MRPINRRGSPRTADFKDYQEARPELVSRLGFYCSYCERKIPVGLAVEHIQPKALPKYKHLEGCWNNFLLGCLNCNSTKKDKDVSLSCAYLPDRDNTFAAFQYEQDGSMKPANGLSVPSLQIAQDTLALTGLDKSPNQVFDSNGQLVAIDRYSQRKDVWLIAQDSKNDLSHSPTAGMRKQIVRLALAEGFFSIWLAVFSDYPEMRKMLIDAFPGTAKDCFDANTIPIKPRPSNGLPACGKI